MRRATADAQGYPPSDPQPGVRTLDACPAPTHCPIQREPDPWRRRSTGSFVQITEREDTNLPYPELAAVSNPPRLYFAAVTCSKRCAIAVLTPLADAEDRAREQRDDADRKRREEEEARMCEERPSYVILDTP